MAQTHVATRLPDGVEPCGRAPHRATRASAVRAWGYVYEARCSHLAPRRHRIAPNGAGRPYTRARRILARPLEAASGANRAALLKSKTCTLQPR